MILSKLLVAAVVIFCFASPAAAQTYPSKPIEIIIPFSAGSATDTLARTLATELTKHWGQPVNGVNIPGKGGVVAAGKVAKALPDGYTLFIHGAFTINPSFHSNLSYDSSEDFTNIAPLVRQSLALLVSPSSTIKSVSTLIASAKDESSQLKFGSPGKGSAAHLAAEKFCLDANIKMKHVPYKGGPEVIQALNVGEVVFSFLPASIAKKFAEKNKVRVLAVTSRQRANILPDVPSISEVGLNDFEYNHWWGIWAPKGVADDLLVKLETDLQLVVATPELQKLFEQIGAEPMSMTSPEFSKFVSSEMESMKHLVQEAGIVTE